MSEVEVKSGISFWLTVLIIVACISYINYGTGMAAAAYVLFFTIAGLIAILGIIPVVGVFIYWYMAKFVGLAIMTSAGVTVGTTLFTFILAYNGIVAFLICVASTTFMLVKISERI